MLNSSELTYVCKYLSLVPSNVINVSKEGIKLLITYTSGETVDVFNPSYEPKWFVELAFEFLTSMPILGNSDLFYILRSSSGIRLFALNTYTQEYSLVTSNMDKFHYLINPLYNLIKLY